MRTMCRVLPLPGCRECWNDWGGTYPAGFCKLVDGLIREGEAAG
jgi:hypothetical protein